jgi:hypothetical protein
LYAPGRALVPPWRPRWKPAPPLFSATVRQPATLSPGQKKVLSNLDGESASASAFGYAESQLRFCEGSAYTNLHDTKAALRAQERALNCARAVITPTGP